MNGLEVYSIRVVINYDLMYYSNVCDRAHSMGQHRIGASAQLRNKLHRLVATSLHRATMLRHALNHTLQGFMFLETTNKLHRTSPSSTVICKFKAKVLAPYIFFLQTLENINATFVSPQPPKMVSLRSSNDKRVSRPSHRKVLSLREKEAAAKKTEQTAQKEA